MAIDIFPKQWSNIPPITARAIRGHALCPRAGFVFNGAIHDLVNGMIGSPASDAIWIPSGVKQYTGMALKRGGTTNQDILGRSDLIVPTGSGSMVIALKRNQAPVADSVTISVDVSFNSGSDFYFIVQNSSGAISQFKVGGTGGAGNLSVADSNFRYDEDSIYTCTYGQRGMEIWENAKLAGSNATIAVRTATTANLVFKNSQGLSNDLFTCKFAFFYDRQLGPADVRALNESPFCWVDPRP